MRLDFLTTTEFIPGGPRTQLANWGTFIGRVDGDEEN
jgi:hypothetical protein